MYIEKQVCFLFLMKKWKAISINFGNVTIFIHLLTLEGVPSVPGAFTSDIFWSISEKINLDNLDV